MTDRVRVTVTFEYDLPDGADREASYGTMDIDECIAIDTTNMTEGAWLAEEVLENQDTLALTIEHIKPDAEHIKSGCANCGHEDTHTINGGQGWPRQELDCPSCSDGKCILP